MTDLTNLFNQFDRGRLSRRDLLRALGVAVALQPAAAFAQGLIDSMAILHLIAFIEDATGARIPTEKVVMKHFQTVTAIAETFGPAA